jgi:rhodanese-related sulfurtransferase
VDVTSQRPNEISPESASMFLAEQQASFIDARPSTDYEQSGVRIPGALQVGAGSGVDILECLKGLPTDRPIIVYCDEPEQAASALIAGRVRELGLGEAFFLKGGFRAWRERRFPVERNPDVAIAPEAQPGG